jgi:putative salt-induced outer membrane protein YdiY
LEYERDIGRRWFIGAANSYQADTQRELDLRIIAAAGVGYRFFDEDPTHLSVMPGLAYVIETFEDSDDDADYVAFRWKFDFTRDLYKDDISIYHNHEYLNSLQTLSEITIETKTGIEFDLAWDFKLSAEFQSIWDNEPASDSKELDTRYILKIGYEFEGDQEDWFH